MNKEQQINADALRLFKITHFTEIVNQYVSGLQKIKNVKILNLINSIYSRNKQYKRELKMCLGNEFEKVFPELNSERIYLYMDLHDKLIYLNETQLAEVIDSIQIIKD
jgi:hypothetical protein